MFIKNYSLVVGKKVLLKETELAFEKGKINHILGRNGSGKSQLAKDFLLNGGRNFSSDISSNTLIISSYSNLPRELTINDFHKVIPWKLSKEIYDLLDIKSIDSSIKLKHLSDGQNQKVKLYVLLSLNKDIIILDEITNALDKTTVGEIHLFLQNYIDNHPDKIIINISHDISDIRLLIGNYFVIDNQKLNKVPSSEHAIKWYLGEE
ncbi:ATP-binding cassette domain-containing protein [Streptococcus orisasini]|uniref:ATP-binding cassette domain-containing protein n=1 Tax=Streptococcus orisasini TaxID=1080071 RepID=UPI00070E2C1B|nr:ABC transporter ATP-binding protein [Streptococcus orisasini]